jgi:glucose/arabinose dehydrogenase/mono/diheme cytochrome c family protein
MRLIHKSRLTVFALAIVGASCAFSSLTPAQSESKGGAAEAKPENCPNDDSGLKLPSGFCASAFADGIGHARHLVVAPSGVVYVNTWSDTDYGDAKPPEGGFLVALQDKAGRGKADVKERFGETVQTGGAGGTGIGLYKGSLYAELNDRIVRYSLVADSIVPKDPSATIVSGLPLGGDHPMHPFIIDAAGAIYIDVGTATNSCQLKNRTLKSPGADPCTELETRGGIWRYDANKMNQRFSKAERFATGIRNGEGFAIDTSGRLFVTQHGRDQLHSNWPDLYKPDQEATLPAEQVMLLKQGGDYGWPECYYDPFVNKLVLAPEYGGNGGKKIGVCASKTPPVAAFPAHWAPNGMVRYDEKQFPARYRNGVFIAFHGSWNRAPYPQGGYNVVFQPMSGDHVSGQCEIFADGFAGAVKTPEGALHRPNGLAVGPDGALYVSDDIRGRIYRITYHGGAVESGDNITPCPSATSPAGEVVGTDANPADGSQPDAGASVSTIALPEGATVEMVGLGDRIYHGQVGGAACTGCHGDKGQGSTLGPDLTGKQWLWSDGSYAGITKTIAAGVSQPKKFRSPMPAMGGAQLTVDQVSALAAFVWTLSHQGKAASVSSTSPPAELSIPGEKIYPESLTSTQDGRVIIGSITARTIFIVNPGESTAAPWIRPDSELTLGVYGVFADEKSNTLYACFSSFPGSDDAAPQATSVLKSFDLKTGAFKERYPLPTAGAFCNDIAVGSDGTAYVSDTENMEVDRLQKGSHQLQVWAGMGGFGPKGGVLDGISVLGNRLFVNTLETSKLFVVPIETDGHAGAISEMKLDRGIENPDGMRSFRKDSLLIVEGGGKGRLSRIDITGTSGHLTTLKEGYPDGAVSVTAVGTTGYVLEGQLDGLFGPAPQKAKTKPFHATAVELINP